MIIPITLNTPSSSSHSNSAPRLPSGLAKISNDEVVLIELQGFLDVEASPAEERNGKFVGKLKIDESGKPSLVIGHHLLEGKIATLPKPLAIFHRVGGSTPRIAGSSSSSTGKGKGKASAGDETPRKRRRTSNGGSAGDGEAGATGDDGMDIDINPGPSIPKPPSLNSPSSDDETPHTREPGSNEEGEEDAEGGELEAEGGVSSWTILGIVKKKIIFSKRPMPISGLKKQG